MQILIGEWKTSKICHYLVKRRTAHLLRWQDVCFWRQTSHKVSRWIRCPSKSLNGRTAYEKLAERISLVGYFRICGIKVLVSVSPQKKNLKNSLKRNLKNRKRTVFMQRQLYARFQTQTKI